MVWLIGFLALWLLSSPATAQISPGKLSRFHQSLEGLSNCTRCHVLGKEVANGKCLDCHTPIQSRIVDGKGYHSSPDVKNGRCASCHSEHNGLDFELVHWPAGKQGFDHQSTGFALEGAHREKDCSGCHRGIYIADNSLAQDKSVNLSHTFLGLSRKCTGCHADEHQGQLAENCLKCHTFEAWKPADKFSHSQTRYPLTGKHIGLDCARCHVWQPSATVAEKISKKEHIGEYAKYAGLTYPNCTPCHEDKHQGRFGQNCQTCHTTAGFKSIVGTAFDHSKTSYPLEGRHRSVDCSKCHSSGDMTRAVAHAACRDCHKDEHGGQFAARQDKGDCNACHSVTGYVPPKYGLTEHEQSRFALKGSHLAVPCSQCHGKSVGETSGRFKFDDLTCKSCHKDIHNGQVDLWIAKGGCEFCHTVDNWHQAAFDHKLARFPLDGRHREVSCLKCHKTAQDGNEVLWVKPLSMECAGCHRDSHQGQFMRAERGEKQTDCRRCHTPRGWKELAFTHSRDTRFKLDGAHEKVACAACHPASTAADGFAFVNYHSTKMECSACHAGKRDDSLGSRP